jgi:hypothetical protein
MYRNRCLTGHLLTINSRGSQNQYFLVFLVAPIMVIESLVCSSGNGCLSVQNKVYLVDLNFNLDHGLLRTDKKEAWSPLVRLVPPGCVCL